jgi:hypothetical protein
VTTAQAHPPEDLLPLEAYLESIDWGPRVAVVSGALFGLGFGTLLLLAAQILAGSPGAQPSLLLIALVATLSGVLFGFFFPRSLQRRLRKTTVKVYRGEEQWAAPPPSEGYRLRLVCSWLRSPSMAVGGALYLGPDVTFVPHRVNLPRDRQVFSLQRSGLAVRVVPGSLSPFQRLLFSSSAVKPRLQLVSGEGTWEFLVPRAGEVREPISEFLAS